MFRAQKQRGQQNQINSAIPGVHSHPLSKIESRQEVYKVCQLATSRSQFGQTGVPPAPRHSLYNLQNQMHEQSQHQSCTKVVGVNTWANIILSSYWINYRLLELNTPPRWTFCRLLTEGILWKNRSTTGLPGHHQVWYTSAVSASELNNDIFKQSESIICHDIHSGSCIEQFPVWDGAEESISCNSLQMRGPRYILTLKITMRMLGGGNAMDWLAEEGLQRERAGRCTLWIDIDHHNRMGDWDKKERGV